MLLTLLVDLSFLLPDLSFSCYLTAVAFQLVALTISLESVHFPIFEPPNPLVLIIHLSTLLSRDDGIFPTLVVSCCAAIQCDC